jgi:hypothetical protein
MTKVTVIKTSLDDLPFHEALEWARYQLLCTDVLAHKLDIRDCREYLRQGNKQEGIDIYATETETDNKVVAQCKLKKYLAPQEVSNLITEFLTGNFATGVKEFILCTSYDLSRHQSEGAIDEARKRLSERGIQLTLWDKPGLSGYLRRKPLPHIVYRYFGEDIAMAFYGDLWNGYIGRLRSVPKTAYKSSEDYIERTVMVHAEYQKKKENRSDWILNQESKEEQLFDIFQRPVSGAGRKVILLSVAGFGKTEELNRLASLYSHKDRIVHPVRYILRDYEGQPVETLLENYNADWKNIPADNLLLLFDGLDEIREQLLSTFFNYLNSFLENNPLTSVLVTSRFNFYEPEHQALRNFDVYILYPISESNIHAYLVKKLGSQELAFRYKLVGNKFFDYMSNPYYLTRLVRFYNSDQEAFPKNTRDLFNKILFEQLERDEAKFRVSELKEQLLPIARKLAFCMTLAGKTDITVEELKKIVPDNERRKRLRHFCILNQNEAGAGTWSFEHKNLQEYLSASLLVGCSFDKIREHISFSFNRNKLLPRFLNTISFLFEMAPKDSDLFTDLFKWIQSHQPELFVRFEKEQLHKRTRQEIFKTILQYYKARNISFRVSPNFHMVQLAAFADIDAPLIQYIEKELLNSKNDYAYDLLQLLATIKRPFIHRARLLSIYFALLNSDSYSPSVYGQCIGCVVMVDPNDKSLFDQLLNSNINLTNFEIRRQLLNALESTSYSEYFIDFVLESIPIYEIGQKDITYTLANGVLKRLLLKVQTVGSLKKVLQYCANHIHTVIKDYYSKGIKLDYEELEVLLKKAAALYKEDASLLKLVYRIMNRADRLLYDEKSVTILKDFFTHTCGTDFIFRKMYQHRWRQGKLLRFASKKSIDFLVNEYMNTKLSYEDAIAIHSNLSSNNRPLMEYYITRLNEATGNAFIYKHDSIDHQKAYADYQEKNQQFLLSQSLFLQEAREVFDKIPATIVTFDDLQIHNNYGLALYEHSLVWEAIIKGCIISSPYTITKAAFINEFTDSENWTFFVIEEIAGYLRNKGRHLHPLKPELLDIAKEWLLANLRETNFTGAVVDKPDVHIINPLIELMKQVYLVMDIQIEDQLLLKMLEADFSAVESSEGLTGVSAKIAQNVKDQALLKATVIQNIRSNNLASSVLLTHFNICRFLKYYECAGDIYAVIISEDRFDDYQRRKLTDYYLELGGEISDFAEFLRPPAYIREGDLYTQWKWYLLEKLKLVEKERVRDILLEISSDPYHGEQDKLRAMTLLLEQGSKEGLQQWAAYIRQHHSLPFTYNHMRIRTSIVTSSISDTIALLVSTLDYALENNISAVRSDQSIQEVIFDLLVSIATRDREAYDTIRNECETLTQKYANEPFVAQIIVFQEKLDQQFYENHEYEISVSKAVELYSELLSQN